MYNRRTPPLLCVNPTQTIMCKWRTPPLLCVTPHNYQGGHAIKHISIQLSTTGEPLRFSFFLYFPFFHFLSLLLSFSFTHTFIHSFFLSFTRLLILEFIHSFIHSFFHSFMHSFLHSFFHSCILSFVLSFFHSFFDSFFHPLFHTFLPFSWRSRHKAHVCTIMYNRRTPPHLFLSLPFFYFLSSLACTITFKEDVDVVLTGY